MKKILFLSLFALSLTACQESLEDRAEREAREITEKRCPIDLDSLTTLMRIDFDKPTRTFTMQLQAKVAALDSAELREKLLKELKDKPAYKPYCEKNFNFHYVYLSKANPSDTLMDLTLTNKDY